MPCPATSLLKLAALLLLALPLCAQPKSPEAFGHIGYGSAQDDEGGVGKGAVYGGAATVPFAQRWAVDVDVQHTRTLRTVGGGYDFGTRRTLVSPAILYRRGNRRTYWFGGAGIGARIETTFSRTPGGGETTSPGKGWTIPLRTGVVTAVTGRLLVRAEVFAVASFLVPDAGVKLGIGYRFR
jgi:hypothetical protein